MTDQGVSESLGKAVDTTVVVSRSVSKSVKDVWKLLSTPLGAEALLGPGGSLGDKGDSWHANDGSYGVVRSYHPLEQIRFSWHVAEDTPKTLVDVHLVKEGDAATTLEIRHEHIPTYFDSGAITKHWEDALERIASAD